MEYRSEDLSEKQLEYVNNHYNTTDNDSYHIISYNNFVFLLFVLGISLLFVNTYKTIYYNTRIRIHRQNELDRLERVNRLHRLVMTNILPRYVIIKNIKIKEYTLNENNHDNERCPICLEDYNIGDILNELICNHFYHKNCINNWIISNNNCPICRSSI